MLCFIILYIRVDTKVNKCCVTHETEWNWSLKLLCDAMILSVMNVILAIAKRSLRNIQDFNK